MTTLRERICEATDALSATKRAFYQGAATLDECRACAVTLLTLRQQAEEAFSGKVTTKITARSIASLTR